MTSSVMNSLRNASYQVLSCPQLFCGRVVYVGREAYATVPLFLSHAHAACGTASAGISADVAGPTRAF